MKLFREKDYPKKEGEYHYYHCDPRKNLNCKKSCCFINGGNCTLTTDPFCSVDGVPLNASNDGRHITKKQIEIMNKIKEERNVLS